jgi:glycerol-3-phosphate acyltransferase PlsY
MMVLPYACWTILCFLCGSFMFSYWLGLLAGHNVKRVGDGNPGAANLWKSAGAVFGIWGIVLDFFKGFFPIWLLIHAGGVDGYYLVLPSAAAVLGHMFSPFLRWKGGKAVAVTFGVWSALTGFAAALAYAVLLAVLLLGGKLLRRGKPSSSVSDGSQIVFGMLLLTALILLWSGFAELHLAVFGMVNTLMLAYAHRRELKSLLAMRTGTKSGG